jgi:hypothetical protein
MYLDTNLFMMPPVMAMQGRIEDMARASLQHRIYAKVKPVRKAEMKLTQSATFSEIPCCTKSRIE